VPLLIRSTIPNISIDCLALELTHRYFFEGGMGDVSKSDLNTNSARSPVSTLSDLPKSQLFCACSMETGWGIQVDKGHTANIMQVDF